MRLILRRSAHAVSRSSASRMWCSEHSRAYDPMEWVLRMGRFDRERWRTYLQKFFDEYEIVHNSRITKKNIRLTGMRRRLRRGRH